MDNRFSSCCLGPPAVSHLQSGVLEPAVLLQKCWLESACNSFATTKCSFTSGASNPFLNLCVQHQPNGTTTTMTCCLWGTQCHHSFSEEMVQQQGWEGRKSSKSSSCSFGSSDWMVIGIGTQQVNVGFDNTLPIVKSITMSWDSKLCGETCRGLPCFCNLFELSRLHCQVLMLVSSERA